MVLLITGFALPTSTVGKLAWALGMVALGLIPVGASIAILRHRLFDIDLLISRSLSYAVLSGVVVALYLVTVTLLGAVFRQPEDPFVSAVAVLVVAVLLNPLRRRLQRATDHVIYGERDEPYAVVRELGRRLGEALDPDAVLPTVARTVARSLRLPYVGIELVAGEEGRIIASHGTPAGATTRLPLVYQQAIVGHLLVSPRPGEHALGHEDIEVLEALTRQAGVAAHGVRVTEELRHARERLVVAREGKARQKMRRGSELSRLSAWLRHPVFIAIPMLGAAAVGVQPPTGDLDSEIASILAQPILYGTAGLVFVILGASLIILALALHDRLRRVAPVAMPIGAAAGSSAALSSSWRASGRPRSPRTSPESKGRTTRPPSPPT